MSLFVNRESERKRLKTAVTNRTNTLVLGERGSGKTSLLRSVEAEIRNQIRVVWVEGRLASDPVELLALLRYRIDPRGPVDYGAAFAQGLAALKFKPAPQSQQLLELVSELDKALRRRKGHWTVFVDELSSAEAAHIVFGRLRDEMWQLPLTWVVAANSRDRATVLRPPADAFFPNVVTLDPLPEQDAVLLLRKRIPARRASAALLKRIAAESGGNPRRLLTLATDALVAGRDIASASDAHAKRASTLAEMGEAAQRVAAELEANGPASASDDEFLARLGMKRSRAAQILAALERAGVAAGMNERSEGRPRRKVYSLVSE
jgi:hypothetical protein